MTTCTLSFLLFLTKPGPDTGGRSNLHSFVRNNKLYLAHVYTGQKHMILRPEAGASGNLESYHKKGVTELLQRIWELEACRLHFLLHMNLACP